MGGMTIRRQKLKEIIINSGKILKKKKINKIGNGSQENVAVVSVESSHISSSVPSDRNEYSGKEV